MSEKHVKDALKKYLQGIGAYYYMPMSMGYSSASIDFFVCHKGKFYGIETKREIGGIVAPRQKEVLRQIAEAGGGIVVENSTGLEATRVLLS